MLLDIKVYTNTDTISEELSKSFQCDDIEAVQIDYDKWLTDLSKANTKEVSYVIVELYSNIKVLIERSTFVKAPQMDLLVPVSGLFIERMNGIYNAPKIRLLNPMMSGGNAGPANNSNIIM